MSQRERFLWHCPHIYSRAFLEIDIRVLELIAQLAVLDSLVGMAAFADYESSSEAAMATRRATSHAKF